MASAINDQATPFLKRQAQIAGGTALIMFAGWIALACATWTVSDPSLSQSNRNMVENWAGASGAVAADLLMQVFGLAAVLIAALPAIWGCLLLAGHPIQRTSRRGWLALAGIVLSAAALGCLPAPEAWPLPIGLGGVAGDFILKFPALATGAYPSGLLGLALALMISIPAGWLYLTGASLINRHMSENTGAAGDEFEGVSDRESRLAIAIGGLAHAAFTVRGLVGRGVAAARERSRREDFGDRFDHWRETDELDFADADPRMGGSQGMERRPVRIAPAPADAAGYADEAEWQHDGLNVPAGPDDDDGGWDAFTESEAARGMQHAVERDFAPAGARPASHADWDDMAEPGWAGDEEPFDEGGPAGRDGLTVDASDRASPNAEPAQEEGSGWRGLLSGNIVAFPGRRDKRTPTQDVRVPSRPAPAPVGRRGPAEPMPGSGARTQNVTADQQRLRSGSGRALAMKPAATTLADPARFELPSIEFLTPPKARGRDSSMTPEALQENARLLEGVLEDFGVKGEIIEVRPGPVVTLYELEPAPGIKSSRVIGLADDIARSMSAIAARVAVIPGKNAIGIELPNQRRETVYFREMLASQNFMENKGKLPLALGKTIGGESVIADLAKMPHLLVAGTTGSGKSVSINTMILSLLYRHTPAECRLIMIDPKMLELSIYDGIPHLLSPVVTDPKKAVVALKWTVREMEDRYRKMSKVGVRNIDGFNARVRSAMEKGETISRTVQTGFDRETGEPIFETEEFDLSPLPYIVVIIDEMADLMMVAGKDIEGAVQRLAQMARAAGIHVIMATQRPSVDVITGTIKANFPTRISFQVTSKIDSRTILGEQGAEQLLGMGDMLFMAGGGRIQRVHGPFVDDGEVEQIVSHLKAQGVPDYLDAILEDDEDGDGGSGSGDAGSGSGGDDSNDPYDQAVAVVLRDGKASTSYIQRRLGIGYNRAASIIERMEKEGIVGPANHAGKREILVPTEDDKL